MLGIHLLALAYVIIDFSSAAGGVIAVQVAVMLGYAVLTLAAYLIRNPMAKLVTHAAASVVLILVAGICPRAIVLLPFHLAAVVPRTGPLSYAGYAIVLGVLVAFSVRSVGPGADTVGAKAAMVLWAVGVIGMDRLIAGLRSNHEALAVRLVDAEAQSVRLGRAARQGDRTRTTGEIVTRLEERHAVATKLHDQLGHMVTGSLFQLEAARLVINENPDGAVQMVTRAEAVLKEGMESIRRSLHTIDPQADEIGIRRLERQVYEFDERTGIRASLEVMGSVAEIPVSVWEATHENVSEALTNCARHSSATQIDISMQVFPGMIKLQVRDNGRPHSGTIRQGIGLRGIEERTARAGGIVTIDSSHGFSLVCLWRRG
jgi:signal transduction histidine kinase